LRFNIQCKLIATRVIFSLINQAKSYTKSYTNIFTGLKICRNVNGIPRYLEDKEWMLMQSQINNVKILLYIAHLIPLEIKLR